MKTASDAALKIAVLDDEEHVRDAIASTLEHLGHEVVLCEDFPTLARALDHVRERRELRPDEWHETPKPMLIAAAERTAHWVRMIEADEANDRARAASA
ncbi:MAG: hypothetical protein KC468_37625 [Myxococcales bacterium]|nr:hypothetical protein [Myxococcales bacterium]